MTPDEIATEAYHRYVTRLGLMVGDGQPTTEQRQMALNEHDQFIDQENRHNETKVS